MVVTNKAKELVNTVKLYCCKLNMYSNVSIVTNINELKLVGRVDFMFLLDKENKM